MTYSGHGGGCCGIHHLWGLDRMLLETFDNHIREHFVHANNNRILEVILSERQIEADPANPRFHRSIIDAGGWPAILAARGFRLAERWRNSNSGNMCYRFVKVEGVGFDETVPAWWTEGHLRLEETPPVENVDRPVAPAAPTVVSTEYFARFQNGIIRGPFESQEAVRGAYPRVLSFVARRILSDGTTRLEPPAHF